MKLKIMNPATGEMIREMEEDSKAKIAEKYKRARAAQPAWAATALEKRLACIREFRKLLVEKHNTLARTTTEEVGKPITQSHNELKGFLGRIDFFLENTPRAIANETVHREDKLEEIICHEPLGVIGNISAWNYPYFVGGNVFVPALLTGNAVLYKPSEFALLTGLAIEELLHSAGIPRDVFTTIVGGGTAGAELLGLPIDGIFFTGSYPTGTKIAEAASRKMIKMQLELGGKDPVYICEDVDIKAAAEATADGAFYNTGQSCCSVERIYVHEKIHDAFVDAFLKTVAGFNIGDPMKDTTYIGPITRPVHLEYLEKQVTDAKAKGAQLKAGGKRMKGPGSFFEPTVFTHVNHDMLLMREESFGPIIGIQKVSSDEEALKLMNDTDYGLTAGVYTQDKARAERLMAQLNAGSVYWNCCDRVSPRLPWSGRKHSGIGSTLSVYGIQTFTQPKAWHKRG